MKTNSALFLLFLDFDIFNIYLNTLNSGLSTSATLPSGGGREKEVSTGASQEADSSGVDTSPTTWHQHRPYSIWTHTHVDT